METDTNVPSTSASLSRRKIIAREWLWLVGCFGLNLFVLMPVFFFLDGTGLRGYVIFIRALLGAQGEYPDIYTTDGRIMAYVVTFAPYLVVSTIRSIRWAIRNR